MNELLERECVFTQDGDFEAVYSALDALREHGFSVGSGQEGSPRGILFGDYSIAKWRNLRPGERTDLHGQMIGGRAGPVRIVFSDYISGPAPEKTRAAINSFLHSRTNTGGTHDDR